MTVSVITCCHRCHRDYHRSLGDYHRSSGGCRRRQDDHRLHDVARRCRRRNHHHCCRCCCEVHCRSCVPGYVVVEPGRRKPGEPGRRSLHLRCEQDCHDGYPVRCDGSLRRRCCCCPQTPICE